MKKIGKEKIENILALTPLQEGILFHYLKDNNSRQYLEILVLDISGDISLDFFEEAWDVVIKTNEMLRTVFRWEMLDKPVQLIMKPHKVDLTYHDFSHLDNNKAEKFTQKIITQKRNQRFNLTDGAFEIILGKIAEKKFQVIIRSHHILYDGWSTGIIIKEFLQAYHELCQGQLPEKPAKNKYNDYVLWLRSQDLKKQERFWNDYLKGFERSTGLPFKIQGNRKSRKNREQDNNYGNYIIRLGSEKKILMENFVKEHRVTLASLLYTAWGILLLRYVNSDDVIFGTTVSGRSVDIKGIEDMVGLFINTIPLRIKTFPVDKCKDLLDRVHHALQTREPFESTPLVDIKNYSQLDKQDVLFDTILVLENYPLDSVLSQTDKNRRFSIDSYSSFEITNYDLSIGITIFKDIAIGFTFNKNRFNEPVIRRMGEHFKLILDRLITTPGTAVIHIDILTEDEKKQLLYRFNDTHRHYPADKTLHEMFALQVEKNPHGIALVGPGVGIKNNDFESFHHDRDMCFLTYGELNRESQGLAKHLRLKGITADTVAGIIAEPSLQMVIGILAILKSGGAYLPIAPTHPADRIKYVLEDSNAVVLLSTRQLPESIKAGHEIIYLSYLSYPAKNEAADVDNTWNVRTGNLAYIIYTSGSTGKPKGVMVEHASVFNILSALQEKYPLEESDVYLLKTSFVFDVSVTELFGWYWGGGRLAILPAGAEKEPEKIIRFIETDRVTHINFVPSMFAVFVNFLTPSHIKLLTGLKYIFLAGEVLLPDLVNGFNRFNTSIVVENIYGPTEAAIYASQYSLGEWDGTGDIPIGKPLPNVKIYIFDRFSRLQPVEVPGELVISGAGIARGYINNPELTNIRFCREGRRYYKTGDLARWLPDGNIQFLGRSDDQVKIRGFRIQLGEIENQLRRHDAVKEAVVLAREENNRKGNRYLCAYVVLDNSGRANDISFSGELRKYLAHFLPDYMVPSYFVRLETMPLTISGKIDRNSLPEPGYDSGKNYSAPENKIEKRLVEMWAEVLARDTLSVPQLRTSIGIDDNFFACGGHSLKATLLMSKIYKEFDVNIPLPQLFKTPSIRGWAAYIKETAVTSYRSIRPVEKQEYYPVSSAQQRLFVLQQMDSKNTVYNMSGLLILVGDVDRVRLEQVFRQLICRHENLRTSFIVIEDRPVQRIHEQVEFEIEYYDLETENQYFQSESAVRTIENIIRPFDLSRAPLLRAGAVLRPGSHALLLVDMHHIISDGLSLQILLEEFRSSWTGSRLTPLKLQYKDFSQWQNTPDKERQESLARQEKYWLEELTGEIPILELTKDFIRQSLQNFAGTR